MPRRNRTYWLYPDLDSAEARRRQRRTSGLPRYVPRGQYEGEWVIDALGNQTHPQLGSQYKVNKDQANLVSSNVDGKEGMHMPVLDLDVPHKYVPSSTEGHGHLYIDVEVEEEKYFALLDLLQECGILEPGYVRASKAKGGTYLRPPGVKKRAVKKVENTTHAQSETAPARQATPAEAAMNEQFGGRVPF